MLRLLMRSTGAAVAAFALFACSPTGEDQKHAALPAQSAASGSDASTTLATRVDAENLHQFSQSVPGELLVKFRARAPRVAITSEKYGVAVESTRVYRSVPGLQKVRLAPGISVTEAIAELRQHADVEYVEPNYIYRLQAVPNDPQFATQWGLHNIGQDGGVTDGDIDAPEAWDITTGSSSVVVAVIDSGVDYTHEDLAANMFRNTADCDADGVDDDANGYVDDCYGIDAVNDDSDPADDNGHGTHVAGIIAAVGNNGIGVTGVAWNARVVACKFADETGEGTAADAIECLDYVAALRDRGVNIVATNNSWSAGVRSRALEDAIERQMQRGILLVAAAGNGIWFEPRSIDDTHLFESGATFPCGYSLPNVICVGASDRLDDISNVSFVGTHTVHVMAPGVDVVSTLPGNQYGPLTGTSMATPHVTGSVVLVKSQFPSLDWRATRNRVLAGGDYATRLPQWPDFGWEGTIARRRINARGALTCQNAVATRRVLPRATDLIEFHSVDEPMTLRVLNINCEQPNGAVSVSVSPGNLNVALADDGTGEDDVAGDGEYTGTWTPQSAGDYTLTFPGLLARGTDGIVADTVLVKVDPYLEPAFPVKARYFANPVDEMHSELLTTVANLDSTPDLEIVTTAVFHGPTYAWKADGEFVPGWPLQRNGRPNYISMLSAGDLDTDFSRMELAGAFSDDGRNVWTDPGLHDPVEAFNGLGQMLPGWPRVSGNFVTMAPTLVDVDGDGIDEIFSGDQDWQLHAYRSDGSGVPGFPLEPSTIESGRIGEQGVLPPLAADLDADGRPELILVSYQGIRSALVVLTAQGTFWPGFPREMPEYFVLSGVGDVDGDGVVEIVGRSGQSQSPTIQILAPDGTLERSIATMQSSNALGTALADMNRDGIPEIVLAESVVDTFWQTVTCFVTVFDGSGATLPGWPAQLSINQPQKADSAPVVGDVDGDGFPEIVLTAHGTLQVLKHDGTSVPGFPRNLFNMMAFESQLGMPPAIADIDADGRNEIVLTTHMFPGENGYYPKVLVYDLHGPSNAGPIEWGQYKEGPQRRGYYELGKNLPTQAYLAVQMRGSGRVASTNPGIDCGTDCIERYTRGTQVQLTATPAAGDFFGWLGACAGQGNPCTLTVSSYSATSAVFGTGLVVAVSGPGRVSSAPGGIDCPGDCSHAFAPNTAVTLQAQPDANSLFTGWTGACSGTALTCSVTVGSATSVGATFVALPLLSVTVAGSGRVDSTTFGIECGELCTHYYDPNATVSLIATPEAEWRFTGWSGDCSGTIETCVVQMSQSRSVTATFDAIPKYTLSVTRAGSGSGEVQSTPSGIFCGPDCSHEFLEGTHVTLTAIPGPFATFTGWSGACSGTTLDCTVSMSAAASVTATFAARPVELNVTRSGNGSGRVVSTPAGIDCGADCSESYAAGMIVTLNAMPDIGSKFAGWSGACSGSALTCTVPAEPATTAVATFVSEPLLSVTVAGSGLVRSIPPGIDCGGDCTQRFDSNVTVSLTATPATEWRFIGWSGACSGTAATCAVQMTSNRSVTATFAALPRHTLSVTRAGSGSGTVRSNPIGIDCGADCSQDYSEGTQVILTASPDGTATFAGWSGACSGIATECTVSMSAARSVTATFAVPPLPLTLSRSGTGSGRVVSTPVGIDCGADCSESYAAGTIVTLNAMPETDSTFAGWSGACTGRSDCRLTMDAARSLVATFTANAVLTVTSSGTGSGRVTSLPDGISCGADCTEAFPSSTVVTLTAAATAGSVFDGWSGACAGQSVTCTVTMAESQTATATFRIAPSTGGNAGSNGGGGGGGGAAEERLLVALAVLLLFRAYRRSAKKLSGTASALVQ